MKKKMIINILVLLLFSSLVMAQSSSSTISKVGTGVAQFLKIGISARSIGMGEAFTAVANDVSSIYWNPAGLAKIHAHEVMFTHTEWLVDTQYEFAALSIDLSTYGTLGLMISSFNSGEMFVTTIDEPDGTGEKFDVADLAIGLAYARELTEKFSIGFQLKYINQRIWHMDASTIALDVGTLFTTPFWGVKLGASISNFGSKMQLDGRDVKFAYDYDPLNEGNANIINSQYEMKFYELPLSFRIGVAKELQLDEYQSVTFAFDAIHPNDNNEYVNVGMEYGWQDMIFLRGGYKSLFLTNSEEGFTLGGGANFRIVGTTKLRVDYAFADFGRLENAQRFSLSIRF